MSGADRLVEIAVSQIGIAEDPRGSNNIIYNTDYYGRPVSGAAYPWCMVFIWWCFREAGLSKLFYDGNRTASCTTLMKWAANQGYFVAGNYRKGDVFLYDYDGVRSDSEHTGIFTGERSGERYQAIEGNYNEMVCSVYRKPSEIIGAFRAQWDKAASAPPIYPVSLTLPEISKGDAGKSVKAMQILLQGYGYSCGRHGTDGEYGDDTQLALLRYQKANGLDADGICGVKTWSSLLK